MWPVISTVVLKIKDFSRSKAVTYTVKVVISRKRCKIDTLIIIIIIIHSFLYCHKVVTSEAVVFVTVDH